MWNISNNKLVNVTRKKQTHRERDQTSGYQWIPFLQGTFPTQDLNPHLLHWQKDSLLWKESPGKPREDGGYVWRHIHVTLSHSALHLRLTQHCKSTTLQ